MNTLMLPIKLDASCWRWQDVQWHALPSVWTLDADAVHVFCLRMDFPASYLDAAAKSLHNSEKAGFNTLRHPRRQKEYLASRLLFRRLWAQYTDQSSEDITGDYSVKEPSQRLHTNAPRLFTSLSHSKDLLVIALARNEVGIDVEHLRAPERYSHILTRLFPAPWRQELDLVSAAPEAQTLFFTRCWTALESAYKLNGHGLLRRYVEKGLLQAHPLSGCQFSTGEKYLCSVTAYRALQPACFTVAPEFLLEPPLSNA